MKEVLLRSARAWQYNQVRFFKLQQIQFTCQSGSIALLILLPLLLTLILALAASGLLLIKQKQLLHTCRQSSQQVQRPLAKGMARLTDLNPKAQRLRRERERLMSLLRMSNPEPATRLIISMQLGQITAQQLALAAQQQMTIAQSKTKARQALALVQVKGLRIARGGANFSLYRSPLGSLSPDYKVPLQFTRMQTLELDWQLSTKSILPQWLAQHLPTIETLRGKCQTTIEKRGREWRIVPVIR